MEFRHLLIESNVSIFARRGGPNYQEGLRMMRDLGILYTVLACNSAILNHFT